MNELVGNFYFWWGLGFVLMISLAIFGHYLFWKRAESRRSKDHRRREVCREEISRILAKYPGQQELFSKFMNQLNRSRSKKQDRLLLVKFENAARKRFEKSASKMSAPRDQGLNAIRSVAPNAVEPRPHVATESRRHSMPDVVTDQVKMTKFEIWVPGFHNSDPYIYEEEYCLGEYEATSFREACEMAIAAKNLQLEYRKIDNTWFGRRLSPNQEEAKKNRRYGN